MSLMTLAFEVMEALVGGGLSGLIARGEIRKVLGEAFQRGVQVHQEKVQTSPNKRAEVVTDITKLLGHDGEGLLEMLRKSQREGYLVWGPNLTFHEGRIFNIMASIPSELREECYRMLANAFDDGAEEFILTLLLFSSNEWGSTVQRFVHAAKANGITAANLRKGVSALGTTVRVASSKIGATIQTAAVAVSVRAQAANTKLEQARDRTKAWALRG